MMTEPNPIKLRSKLNYEYDLIDALKLNPCVIMAGDNISERALEEITRLQSENKRLVEAVKGLLETIAPTPTIAEVQNRLDGQSTFNVKFQAIADARSALPPQPEDK